MMVHRFSMLKHFALKPIVLILLFAVSAAASSEDIRIPSMGGSNGNMAGEIRDNSISKSSVVESVKILASQSLAIIDGVSMADLVNARNFLDRVIRNRSRVENSLAEFRKKAFDYSDEKILQEILVAKGQALAHLVNLASPSVLKGVLKQERRPNVVKKVNEILRLYGECAILKVTARLWRPDQYNDAVRILGGMDTSGYTHPRDKSLSDGVYAAAMIQWGLEDWHFYVLNAAATATTLRLVIPKLKDGRLAQAKDKYQQTCIMEMIKKRVQVTNHVKMIMEYQSRAGSPVVRPKGDTSNDLSVFEPVLAAKALPQFIITSLTFDKLCTEDIDALRPHWHAIMTHFYETKLNPTLFLQHINRFQDEDLFVAFLDVFGENLKIRWHADRTFSELFDKFLRYCSSRGQLRVLMRVRSYLGARKLFTAIPTTFGTTDGLLDFLAQSRVPLEQFVKNLDGWRGPTDSYHFYQHQAAAILERRASGLKDAVLKGNLEYVQAHLNDFEITTSSIKNMLMENWKIISTPMFQCLVSFLGPSDIKLATDEEQLPQDKSDVLANISEAERGAVEFLDPAYNKPVEDLEIVMAAMRRASDAFWVGWLTEETSWSKEASIERFLLEAASPAIIRRAYLTLQAKGIQMQLMVEAIAVAFTGLSEHSK